MDVLFRNVLSLNMSSLSVDCYEQISSLAGHLEHNISKDSKPCANVVCLLKKNDFISVKYEWLLVLFFSTQTVDNGKFLALHWTQGRDYFMDGQILVMVSSRPKLIQDT